MALPHSRLAALVGSIAAAVALASCSGSPTSSNSGGPIPTTPQSPQSAQRILSPSSNGAPGNSAFGHSHKVCADVSPGFARCHSYQRDDLAPTHLASDGKPHPAPSPTIAPAPSPTPVGTPTPIGNVPPCTRVAGVNGFQPCELRTAYNLTTIAASNGGTSTVAIVDAYDDPNAESDLATYRSTFGIAPCTTANGCFRKVNQSGAQGPYPTANASWGQEISLDLDMASAICPNCRILLVEGNSNSNTDLAAAVDEAAALGATSISNSYGSAENTAFDSHYNSHPGIAITASSGDSGYGTQSPASAIDVIAVGGTALTAGGTRPGGYSETAWSGAGSGCSTANAKQTWQSQISACGSFRAEADVAAVADPNTGVAVYDTFAGRHASAGWLVFGGTSVASPIVGAVYGLAHSGQSNASKLYAAGASLFDVTSGSNGSCGAPVCVAGPGWDGPTGVGSPNGIAAF